MKILHRLVVAVSLGLLTVASAPSLLAQQADKPAVVVSITGIDRLLANIRYLTQAAGTPELGGLVTMMSGQYVEGLDAEKPAGMFVKMLGQPAGIAFLPVSDFDSVIAKIEESLGEPEDLGGGLKKISLQRDIFFKETAGWVYISDAAANLEELPEDPSTQLGTLPADYEVAFQVNVQSIPAPLREMAIAQMKEGFNQSLEGASDEERELQEKIGKNSINNLVSFIQEADQFTVGWGVDSENGETFIDVEVTAIPGSSLVERLALLDGNETQFAGFLLPDAAAKVHFTSRAAKEDIEQTMVMLEVMRDKALEELDDDDDLPDDETREKAKDIVRSLIKVLEDTVSSGRFDGGGALLLNNGTLQLVAGGYLSDGAAVEANLKELVELARSIENEPALNDVEFNKSSYQGVELHAATVPIPADEDEARSVFGDELSIVVGTGEQSAYVALGTGCETLLKTVIDKSASQPAAVKAPMTMDIAMAPILEFAASIENQPEIQQLAAALQQSNGKDHISVTVKTVPKGVSYRVRLQEGVLQLIGAAAKMQGGR